MPWRRLGERFRRLGQPIGFPIGARKAYSDQVLSLFGSAVIGYWKLDEPSGTAVIDSSPQNQTNGLYSGGVSLANAVSPPGTLAPLFDGTNGLANVQSVGWAADFNGAEGSFSVWANSLSPLNFDFIVYFAVNGSNRVGLQNFNAVGQYQFVEAAGGTNKNKSFSGISTGWHNFVMTWSKTGDQIRHYVDAVEIGVPLNGMGIFAGVIAESGIGGTAGLFWNGHIAHVYFLNRAMTPTEVSTQYGFV